jgi:aquaporin Z
VGIALTFGLIVLAMIYTLGDISGAHINPAVTIGFWAARRFEWRKVLPYVVSQCEVRSWQALSCDFFFQLMSHLEQLFPQVL